MDEVTEQPKPMSAAEYAAHAVKVKEQWPTQIVTLKSGSVFELRRPNLRGYVITGRLPQSLLVAGIKVKDAGSEKVSAQDAADFPAFAASILRECCVNPKADEIDMLPEDAWEIYNWVMDYKGVAGVAGLHSFHPERQPAPADSPDGPEHGNQTIATVADER